MIVVVGAGPAGLSAAYHLKKEYIVLEREQEVGGLCRSFEVGGFTFDLGGHAFFTRHAEVRELLWSLANEQVFTQARAAWVHSHGVQIPFPFQANLYGLPVAVVKECLNGLYEAMINKSDAPPQHLLDWILRSFGPGIARQFLIPYNEKVWAHPLESINPSWTGQRIVQPNLAEILEGALHRVAFKNFDNANVSYPLHGGFMGFFKGLAEAVRPQLRSGELSRLDLASRSVETSDGERYDFERMISTIPLTQLVERTTDVPPEVRRAAGLLRHNSLHLVNLVFDRPDITDMQRLYVADPDIPFHKLVFNANSSPTLKHDGGFPIQAEISWSAHKIVPSEGLVERTCQALQQIGITTPTDRLLSSSITTLPLAYPVYDGNWHWARTTIFDFYRDRGVYCAGRFGEWLYINSDAAVLRGMQVAAEVNVS